ncbi:ABC transporter ATP-binding protein [Paenibacillus protaetiae]|uniref:ABC transporter ATP-binding protein n=2 Tax=Paenibacillus protaetiae TaxID=2509456 RepID=A0A4V0YFQ8_9BACL|nr:ABC transporter ATP-binding protein [Paenibacillus protaetiae]
MRRMPIQKPRKGSITAMYKRVFLHVRSHIGLLVGAVFCIVTVSALEFVIPQLTQYTIDHVIPGKQYSKLLQVGAGMLAAALLLGLFNYCSSRLMASVGQRSIYDLRGELYRHIQTLDIDFFDRNRTGDLMSRVTSDVGMLQQLISSGMLSIVTDSFTFILVAAYMLWIDWELTVIILATFPIMFIVTRYFSKRLRLSFKRVQETVGEVSNHLQDTLSSIRLIKWFSSEDYEGERFAVKSRDNMNANIGTVKLRAVYEPLIDLLSYAGLAAVLLFGAMRTMDGALTVGTIVMFMSYLRLLQNPVRSFSRTINTVQQSAAAYERIVEILDARPAVKDKPDAVVLGPIEGHIRFRNVDFAYHTGTPVLRQLNLDIPAGKMTALVGSSGAGKSTITHLMTRFYDPQQGTVTVDGIPLADVAADSLRSQMGIVSQDILLLNGTIRDNIAYGKRDATDEQIIAAAKAANAHDFIQSFPDGYNAQIGERGVKLSGGQKQRLSIARALLRDPRIIILDEATSSLDTESERAIQDALQQLLHGRTSLVIAHRLSTVRQADSIHVLDKGQVIESGSHESLLNLGGKYTQLYELQFPQDNKDNAAAGKPVAALASDRRRQQAP